MSLSAMYLMKKRQIQTILTNLAKLYYGKFIIKLFNHEIIKLVTVTYNPRFERRLLQIHPTSVY